jgi:hypothetical protein
MSRALGGGHDLVKKSWDRARWQEFARCGDELEIKSRTLDAHRSACGRCMLSYDEVKAMTTAVVSGKRKAASASPAR